MQPRKVFFVGLEQGLHFWKNRRSRIERSRRGEEEGFREQSRVQRTWIPGRADILFARNRPERTTDRDLRKLQRFIDRLDDGRRLVVNPQRDFLLADSKDRAFSAWSAAGLPCPRHWLLETDGADPSISGCVDQVLSLLKSQPRILLRTNNEWESRGMYIVDREASPDHILQVLRSLAERTLQLRRVRADSRITAVEYVDARDSDGYTTLARVFIVLDRVFNHFAMVSDKLEFRVSKLVPESYDRWVEANRRLCKLVEDPSLSSQLVRAVSALGNNIGAVDVLVRDGKPVFLEVNPMWGGIPRRYSFGNADFERLVKERVDSWSKELPNVAYNLDVVRFYRDMYGYIAEYFDRRSNRSGMD